MATEPLQVLAIDPGEKVGWARGSASPDSFKLVNHGITDLKPFALALGKSITKYDVVVYETYRLIKKMNKEGSDMPTSQLIGMIRLLAWQNPRIIAVAQSPGIKSTADKTAFLAPEIKDLLDREPGTHDDAHDVDAVRHLWYWHWNKHIKEANVGKQA